MGDSILDGVVAQDEKQFDQLWFIRKGIITACSDIGWLYKANVAMQAITDYYSPMHALNLAIEHSDIFTAEEKDLLVPCGYGHMADGDI